MRARRRQAPSQMSQSCDQAQDVGAVADLKSSNRESMLSLQLLVVLVAPHGGDGKLHDRPQQRGLSPRAVGGFINARRIAPNLELSQNLTLKITKY